MSYKNQVVLTLGPHRTTGIGEFTSSYIPFLSHILFLSFTLLYPTIIIYSCILSFYTFLYYYTIISSSFLHVSILCLSFFIYLNFKIIQILYNFILLMYCVLCYFLCILCLCMWCLVYACATFWNWPFGPVLDFDFCPMDLHSFFLYIFYGL